MKYRKKPIIVEAYQTDVELDIETLEGVMHASVGDYIITGVNGEKYPCKPDIFEKTYELVKENNYEIGKETTPLKAIYYLLDELCKNCKSNVCEVKKNGACKYFQNYKITENALKDYENTKARLDDTQALSWKYQKELEIISQNFKLVGNCLHAKNEYAERGWIFVKEIEDEEELKAWKEVVKKYDER